MGQAGPVVTWRTVCRLALLAFAALSAGSGVARAGEGEAPRELPATNPSRVEFRATRVDLDPDSARVTLEDDAEVHLGRYHIAGERLELQRDPHGLRVDGSASVAFCPCPDPPLVWDFDSATVAPNDLFLENATLKVGGAPVLWLPYIWLRSPKRIGLLPPRPSWRGDDGLFLGTGLHVPLDADAESVVDLMPGLYVRGGSELGLRVRTPETRTDARWDRVDRDLVAFEAQGHLRRARSELVWDVSALRGPRARSGTVDLDAAARPYDHAVVRAGVATAGVSAALFGVADAPRGLALDAPAYGGPGAGLSVAAPLLDFGTALAELGVQSTAVDGITANRFRERYLLEFSARPGPLLWSAALEEEAELVETGFSAASAARASAQTVLGLPLVRDYGASLTHWVEPRVNARLGALGPVDAALRRFSSVTASLKNVLGSLRSQSGAEVELGGGLYSGLARGTEAGLATHVGADTEGFALSHRSIWLPRAHDGALLTRGRVGSAHSLHVVGTLDGRIENSALAGGLLGDFAGSLLGGWLDRPGWSTGGELRVPWTSELTSALGADYDLGEARWLALRASIAYHHACACLDAVLWSASRVGRGGFDIGASLGLDAGP